MLPMGLALSPIPYAPKLKAVRTLNRTPRSVDQRAGFGEPCQPRHQLGGPGMTNKFCHPLNQIRKIHSETRRSGVDGSLDEQPVASVPRTHIAQNPGNPDFHGPLRSVSPPGRGRPSSTA